MSDQADDRFSRRAEADARRRGQLGEGPGELTATFGFRMDWGPALAEMDAFCQRFRGLGAKYVGGMVEEVQGALYSQAMKDLEVAREIAWEQAQDNVPYQTGYLHSTGHSESIPVTSDLGIEGGGVAIGRYTATYAAVVHEEPDIRRESGERKWLENAWMAGWSEFTARLRRSLPSVVRTTTPVLVGYDSVHGRLRVDPGRAGVGRDPAGKFRSLRGATPIYE